MSDQEREQIIALGRQAAVFTGQPFWKPFLDRMERFVNDQLGRARDYQGTDLVMWKALQVRWRVSEELFTLAQAFPEACREQGKQAEDAARVEAESSVQLSD